MHFNLKSKGDSHARTVHTVRDTHYFTGRAYTRETGLRWEGARGPKQKVVVATPHRVDRAHRASLTAKTYAPAEKIVSVLA